MPHTLPPPIARYVAARNAGDLDTARDAFAADAVVRDEGETRPGHTAIRRWLDETQRKYRDTTEIEDAVAEAGTHLVTARVSGTFPGSPVTLRFRFTVADDRILHLEIGA